MEGWGGSGGGKKEGGGTREGRGRDEGKQKQTSSSVVGSNLKRRKKLKEIK